MTSIKPETQKRYFEIYELHLRKFSQPEIAERIGCCVRTVGNAIRFYRENVVRPSRDEDFQDAIDLLKSNLREMHSRLEEVLQGVEETITREKPGYLEVVTTRRPSLTAEMTLRKEIRETEKLLFSYQGLLQMKQDEKHDQEIVIKFESSDGDPRKEEQ